MIPFNEAVELTLIHTNTLGIETVAISDCAGCVLAENVYADINMPPFEKSMMDGYAVRSSDCEKAPVVLDIVEIIPAGFYPKVSVQQGQASKIMTGAPIPEGADTVQIVEKTEQIAGNKVRILEPIAPHKHIANQGEIMEAGDLVLEKDEVLFPNKIGLLATVGKAAVKIYKRPKITIIVTGSELVGIEEKPGIGQIRNSNGYALNAQVLNAGCQPVLPGSATDDLNDLKQKIELGLQSDILLISGGVSMGEYDLVKTVLDEFGVKIIYDKVNIKPGKPTVFGKTGEKLVFGLPGNPVSASTIFELIVRPALRKMMGHASLFHKKINAVLEEGFDSRTRRECYHPAFVRLEEDKFYATPIKSRGSADIIAFAKSNAFIMTDHTKSACEQGETITAVLRNDFWQ